MLRLVELHRTSQRSIAKAFVVALRTIQRAEAMPAGTHPEIFDGFVASNRRSARP